MMLNDLMVVEGDHFAAGFNQLRTQIGDTVEIEQFQDTWVLNGSPCGLLQAPAQLSAQLEKINPDGFNAEIVGSILMNSIALAELFAAGVVELDDLVSHVEDNGCHNCLLFCLRAENGGRFFAQVQADNFFLEAYGVNPRGVPAILILDQFGDVIA